MNIFVLEDDFKQQTRIETVIHTILNRHQLEPKFFEIFGKPHQLLEAITDRGAHQIFFLDIEIKNESQKGLEVAQKIRQKDPHATIVFVTTHSEFMPLSFKYQTAAFDYIDKAMSAKDFETRIEQCLLYVNSQTGKAISEDAFYFESKYAQVQYPFNTVLYLETSLTSHRVILHTQTGTREFTATLSEIVKANPKLIHCHRSFAVNPTNIVRLDKKEKLAYFENGGACSVSRRKLEQLEKALTKLHR